MSENTGNDHILTRKAAGNIRICRFLTLSPTFPRAVVEVTDATTQMIVGVSQQWSKSPPGTPFEGGNMYAAVSGDLLLMYGPLNECNVIVGAGTAPVQGDIVTSHTDGSVAQGDLDFLQGATNAGGATKIKWHGGYALESATAGDLCRIYFNPFPVYGSV
jgi:hypothetical protein